MFFSTLVASAINTNKRNETKFLTQAIKIMMNSTKSY